MSGGAKKEERARAKAGLQPVAMVEREVGKTSSLERPDPRETRVRLGQARPHPEPAQEKGPSRVSADFATSTDIGRLIARSWTK